MKHVLTKSVAVLAAGLVFAGCGAPAPGPTTAAPSVDPARVSPTDLPAPPVVKDAQGAIRDLALGACETRAGKQTVKGELKSSQAAPADFLVTVSWTTASGDVMGRGYQVVRNLAPGETKKLTITATVADGAVQCVKGVQFGTIKK